MRRGRSNTLLADPRPRSARNWFIIPVLLFAAALGYFLLGADDEESARQRTQRLVELDRAVWDEGELNQSSLPGENQTETTLAVQANTDDPFHIKGRVQRNQTIFVTLRNRGIAPARIHPLIEAMSTVFDFRRSKPGDQYEARLDLDGNLIEFRYQCSPEEIYLARLVGDRYVPERVEIPKETRRERVSGVITTSLFKGFSAIGEKGELAQAFMDLFVYDFDFGSDARPGDRFTVLVDKVYLDGAFYKYGKVLAAQYETPSQSLSAFYFGDDESGEFYDYDGRPLRRMFLKAPILNCKITSYFSKRRFHPILKRYRPHYGIDWACPTGTPILAAADGVVTFAAWKGGNGNLLVIEHDNGYVSLYAHLKNFARGIEKGSKVRQHQVVAYLGNTGISTGPHLHYGLRKDGVYVDPLAIEAERDPPLTGAKLKRFKEERDAALEELKTPAAPPAPNSLPQLSAPQVVPLPSVPEPQP
ncbi:MAG: M23 family metallopeptidase [Myxococcota bacterium]|nr:M23 family metallopeptidase [Myxococcota bacterium]